MVMLTASTLRRATSRSRSTSRVTRSDFSLQAALIYDAGSMDQHTAPNERQQYGEKFQSHTSVEKKRWRKLLEERFPDVITGVLSCYDRLMLQGTLPNICFAGGMEQFLRTRGIAY